MSEIKLLGKIRVVGTLGLGYFINTAQELSLPMLFPEIKKSFSPRLTLTDLAVIDGVRVIIQTMITPLFGVASDRFSRKWVLVIGTGFWGGLTIFCGMAATYYQLFAAWVFCCLGIGALVPAGFSMLADIFSPDERGTSIGVLNFLGMLGIIILGLAAGPLMGLTEYGWRLIFVLIGASSILVGILIAVLVKEPVRGAAEPELDDVIADLATAKFRFRARDIMEVARSLTVWAAFIQGFFVVTSLYLVMKFYTSWLVEERKFTEENAPMVMGAVVFALAVGSVVGGIVSDLAERRSPQRGRAMVCQAAILVVAPTLAILLTLAHDTFAIMAASVVFAFFVEWPRRAVLQPMIQNVMRPEIRGTALALAEFFQGGLASLFIILIAGYADRAGITKALLYGASGCYAAGFVVCFVLYYSYPRDLAKLREKMAARRENILDSEKASGS